MKLFDLTVGVYYLGQIEFGRKTILLPEMTPKLL